MNIAPSPHKYTEVSCRDKVSPNCAKTFKRKIQRGRPPVNCDACKNHIASNPVKKVAVVEAHNCDDSGWDCTYNNGVKDHHKIVSDYKGMCPCGNSFPINPGRGRKRTKCDVCRDAGIVYRSNDDGEVAAIQAETLAAEQRELREQAGRDRAKRLTELMAPLLKDNRERRVIVR